MYFPWVGFLSQMSMAHKIIWLDDVKYSKGSFTNRVQLKTDRHISWLTCTLKNKGKNYLIKDLELSSEDVIEKQLRQIKQAYGFSSFYNEICEVYKRTWKTGDDLCGSLIKSSQYLCRQLGVNLPKQYRSSEMGIRGVGSTRVLDLVKSIDGDLYLTGHGAKNYLQHEDFNASGVDVHYMIYDGYNWQQRGDLFSPYVTGLDLIANIKPDARSSYLKKTSIDWRSF